MKKMALLGLAFALFAGCSSESGSDNHYSYTITFDSNQATIPASPQSKVITDPNTTIDSLPSEPIRTDFTFIGWYVASMSQYFTENTVITSDIVATAVWKYNYIVEYVIEGSGNAHITVRNGVGGTDEYDNITLVTGNPVKYRFTTFSSSINPYGTAKLDSSGGTIKVSVYYDGVLEDSVTSYGANAFADAIYLMK